MISMVLSEILAVGRPTRYSFLDGKEPSESEEAICTKIRLIDSLAQMDSSLPLPGHCLLTRRDFSGRMVKGVLKDDLLKESDICTFIAKDLHYQTLSTIRSAAGRVQS